MIRALCVPRKIAVTSLAVALVASSIGGTSGEAGADELIGAVDAARAVIPVEAWDSVSDLLPQTTAEATPRKLTDLTVAQQSIVLQSLCTQLSNGVVVFTCEDELNYATGLSAPFEIVFQAVEATNAILVDCKDVSTDCPTEPLVTNTSNYVVGDPQAQTTLDTLLASAIPQGGDDLDENELRSVDLYPIGVQVIMPSGRLLLPDPGGLARRYRCGYFTRPNPRRANAALPGPDQGGASTQAGAVRQARQWGYTQGFHDTPARAGGGMTRPQTWNPFLCGAQTYRDHAFPDTGTHEDCTTTPCKYYSRLLIQDYTVAPFGEPNPEVWRSGPWPYPEWPAYVAWWHRTR